MFAGIHGIIKVVAIGHIGGLLVPCKTLTTYTGMRGTAK